MNKQRSTFVALAAALLVTAHLSAVRADDEQPATVPAKKPPADYAKLKAALPDAFGGVKRTGLTGERSGTEAAKYSQAVAKYGDPLADAPSATLTVTDYASMPETAQALTMTTQMDIDNDSDTALMRTVKVGGRRALQELKKASKNGTITLLVADRFLVVAVTHKLDADAALKALEAVDWSKIEELAK